jgi:hypothetical protein
MSRYTFEGPRWYRGRIRGRGPLVALLPPAILGLLALLVINVGNSAGTGLTGLVLAVLAAPGLLAVGAPFSSSVLWPIGIVLSVVLWVVVGYVAARRATRNPMATWSDFWRNYGVLAVGVCLGASVAVIVARMSIGDVLSF